jgi:hypothetical protein
MPNSYRIVPTPGRKLPSYAREMANQTLQKLIESPNPPPAAVALDEEWTLSTCKLHPSGFVVHLHPETDRIERWIPWALKSHPSVTQNAQRFFD